MGWAKYGGKRKVKPIYNNIQFDSTEEVEFYMWCQEAIKNKMIEEVEFHNKIFKLFSKNEVPCPKTLRKQGFLTLQDCEYELDFRIKPTEKFFQLFDHNLLAQSDGWIYIDTKGDFKGADTVFSIKQKLMYIEFCIYVNRVVPIKFFKRTWRPERAGLTPKRGDIVKGYQKLKTLKELGL